MGEGRTKKISLLAILIALALVLAYLESLVPAFFAVPGMKLGLTNLVVLVALYRMDVKSALFINLIRILLVALLFGTVVSLWYSLAGGAASFLVMILLQKTGRFSPVTVSIFGGVAHNVGQILCAMVLLETSSLLWYLLVLWFSGIAAGALVGVLGALLMRRLPDAT